MLADRLDYVIGVDPHRDRHALAVVEVRSGGAAARGCARAGAAVAANRLSNARWLKLMRPHAILGSVDNERPDPGVWHLVVAVAAPNSRNQHSGQNTQGSGAAPQRPRDGVVPLRSRSFSAPLERRQPAAASGT